MKKPLSLEQEYLNYLRASYTKYPKTTEDDFINSELERMEEHEYRRTELRSSK